jgi:RND superfamily putative drug exporter
MATFLYRIGRFSYRNRLLVIAVWVLLLAGAAASTTLAKPFLLDFNLPGTETERAGQMLDEKFPGQGDMDMMANAKVVIQAPAGTTFDDRQNIAGVDALVAKLGGLDHVVQPVANPLTDPAHSAQVNADRTIAYLDVVYDQKFVDVEKDQVDAFKAVLQQGRDAGLTAEATGTIYNGQPPQQGASELLGFGVALIVMIIAFASVVAATLPIITAIFGVGVAVASITGATAFINMDSSALMIASMLGIAVAIDYSLFIVSRYRHELNSTHDPGHAAGRAVGTAGSSVVFAGLTVIIALVALSVVRIPMMAVMGYTAAVAVAVAVLTAITLLPAILGLFGSKVFALRIPGLRRGDEPDSQPTTGSRWAKFVVGHPVSLLAVAIAVLGVIAIPVTKLELGMELATGDQKKAVQLIGQGFGEGVTGPLMVVVDGDGAANPRQAYAELGQAITAESDIAMVTPPQVNADGSGAILMVMPKSGPSSPQTQALMHNIRDLEPSFADKTGIQFGVTGQTAMLSDMSEALLKSLLPYLALVVGLAFLVLMLVFRSLLVPLTATLGFLLSIGATFGATVAIFQEGWFGLISDPGPIISFLPTFMIGVVFGLAMDYQVFLVTRMREEYIHGARGREGAKAAVVVGFQHGARVVTSAAIIMVSVFAAFMLSPETVAKAMGFALAAAVFFDAFVVRMVVIPALMSLLGESAWYLPRWIDKILPNVDIEGERLKSISASPAAPVVSQLVPVGAGAQQRVIVAAGSAGGRHRLGEPAQTIDDSNVRPLSVAHDR